MKKLTLTLVATLIIGLGLFLFTRDTQTESVATSSALCDSEISCHPDGVREYKTMTPLSTLGAVLAGASAVGLIVVVGNQAMKKGKRKK